MKKLEMGLAFAVLIGVGVLAGCDEPEPVRADPAVDPPAASGTAPATKLPDFLHRHPEEFTEPVAPKRAPKTLTLACKVVKQPPVVDGRADDPVWKGVPMVTTLDRPSQRPINLKAVYRDGRLYVLATWPDASPSQTHKTWVWNAQGRVYRQWGDREDAIVFKWSMVGNDAQLSFVDAQPHEADLWFWKACRTNPAGYADDKRQTLSTDSEGRAQQVPSEKYGSLYLRRMGDAGRSAYEEHVPVAYTKDWIIKYAPRQPEGSRADIRAKGQWHDGRWTVELTRLLDTGHEDDLAMAPGGTYLFGVSCYEMAATHVDTSWTQPLYRTGDVFDRIMFQIEAGDGN